MEPTDNAEAALEQAHALEAWSPAVSHLVHMSSHIYFRVGMWDRAVESSLPAVASDERLARGCGHPYAPGHNVALLQHAAMRAGRRAEALRHAVPLAGMPEGFSSGFTGLFALPSALVHANFGAWDAILREDGGVAVGEGGGGGGGELAEEASAFVRATFHYTKGLAHANLGDSVNALKHLAALRRVDVPMGMVPAGHAFYGNHPEMAIMYGHILNAATMKGKEPRMRAMERALAIDDTFTYLEVSRACVRVRVLACLRSHAFPCASVRCFT